MLQLQKEGIARHGGRCLKYAGYVSNICSLKRSLKQASTAKRFQILHFRWLIFRKHAQADTLLLLLLFFTQYRFSIFTLFAILKKREINTQFQQATINLPPLPFRKDTKINIFANDRQVNVNSSYETQENRYSLPSYLAIIQKKIRSKHTPKEPEVSNNMYKIIKRSIIWHFHNIATFFLRLPNSFQSYFIRVAKKVINKQSLFSLYTLMLKTRSHVCPFSAVFCKRTIVRTTFFCCKWVFEET